MDHSVSVERRERRDLWDLLEPPDLLDLRELPDLPDLLDQLDLWDPLEALDLWDLLDLSDLPEPLRKCHVYQSQFLTHVEPLVSLVPMVSVYIRSKSAISLVEISLEMVSA
jgi:hypothetical protein